jgi:F0F1-type ATP synthase membrane subunit b/b'
VKKKTVNVELNYEQVTIILTALKERKKRVDERIQDISKLIKEADAMGEKANELAIEED